MGHEVTLGEDKGEMASRKGGECKVNTDGMEREAGAKGMMTELQRRASKKDMAGIFQVVSTLYIM